MRKRNSSGDYPWLLPPEEMPERPPQPKHRPLDHPIWTENKAKLIERYLYYFEQVTKHGTYIDGFAGPQQVDKADMWAAKLVLDLQPLWFRHFYLCDKVKSQARRLESLKKQHPDLDIHVLPGDFNTVVDDVLSSLNPEATFCLLDQRTFECHWGTVKAVAEFKAGKNTKIELFYFLAVGWMHKAMKGTTKNQQKLVDWWGGPGWDVIYHLTREEVAKLFCQRVRDELGYKHVDPWPIYDRKRGGSIKYYMIHATDHDAAPRLMRRAYYCAVRPKETAGELQRLLFEPKSTC